MTLAAKKKALRLAARAARARAHALGNSTAQDAAGQALKVLPFRAGQIVSAYWPVGDELDTRPLMAALAARGCILALPKVVGRLQPLLFQRWRSGDPLVPGVLGIPAPVGEGEAVIVTPEILVVPLLAFDRMGFRLGQGGGYYDVTLQVLRAEAWRAGRAVLAAGFAYGAQEISAVPRGAHDQRLDWIITEREAIEVPR
ncbi:MAG: 5-formyltetrahydrofolate cyclo-ligase [Alphaproteobacteria bacterium]